MMKLDPTTPFSNAKLKSVDVSASEGKESSQGEKNT